MLRFVRSWFFTLVSSEVSATKAKLKEKSTECKLLTAKAQRMDRELLDLSEDVDRLQDELGVSREALRQNDIVIEERDSAISLQEFQLEMQQSIIQRDLELRKAERLAALSQLQSLEGMRLELGADNNRRTAEESGNSHR